MDPLCSNSPVKSHSFFKIILEDIVPDSKLIIPRKFVRKCGKDLAGRVFLKAPCGAHWQVKLDSCNGKVWLQNGWQEFATYYSVCFGHVLVFRYVGMSLFHVTIFDKSASEVDYPVSDNHIEKINLNRGPQEGKELLKMDDCTINQEKSLVQQYSGCPVMEKPILPYSQTYKRKRVSSVCEEANHNGGCWMRKKNQSEHTSSTKWLKTKDTDESNNITNQIPPFKSTCVQHNRMKPIKLEEDLDSHASAREVKGNGVCGSLLVTEADKAKTLASAKAFRSDNPFFIVVMRPSYVSGYNVSLSKGFAEKFITKEFDKVILQGTDGRTWPVKCTLHSNSNSNAKLSRGWSGFARDNHLVEEDVCTFELINRSKKLLKVVIFRVKENIKCE